MSSTIPMSIPASTAAALADFTGREWVFRRLSTWLDEKKLRTILITGEPGSGKSTLAARLVQISLGEILTQASPRLRANWLTCTHFCQARMSETSLDPLRFVASLSQQLADRYPPFASALTQVSDQNIIINATPIVGTAESGSQVTGVIIKELHIHSLSARVAFDRVIRQPLEQLQKRGFQESVVILVDSLDEALTYDSDENIVTLLSHISGDAADLPPQVRFVLTCRSSDRRVLDAIGGSSLDLIDNAPDSVDDVREYVYQQLHTLAEPQRGSLTKRVAEGAKGNFLYAHYVLESLLLKRDQHVDLSNFALPRDLKDIYLQFLKRELGQNSSKWSMHYRPLLGALAVARGQGLTRTQLACVIGYKQSETDDSLLACAQYLTGLQPDGPFRLYHQSFRDFLLTNEQYRIYPAEANKAIANLFLEEYKGNWQTCGKNYALEYTSSHLVEAIQQTEQRQEHQRLMGELIVLLDDFDFLETRTAMLGVDAVLLDLRTTLGLIPSESESQSDVPILLRVLSRESHSLRKWIQEKRPPFFAQQMHNRAIYMGLPHLATRAAKRLSQLTQPYLALLWLAGPRSSMLERTLVGHEGSILCVAVTPDGNSVISGSADRTLRIWNLHTGQSIHTLTGHESSILCVAVTPDGNSVISGSADQTLRIWNLHTGQSVHTLTGHKDYVNCVAVTPDGRSAISGANSDLTLRVWDLQTGKLMHSLWSTIVSSFSSENESVKFVITLPNSRSVISGHNFAMLYAEDFGGLKVWDLQSGQLVQTIKDTEKFEKIFSLAVTPDGRHAISGSWNGVLNVWDIQTGQSIYTFTGHQGEVHAVAITPDNYHAISGSGDGALKVWNLQNGQIVHTLSYHEKAVSVIAITPNGHHAISGSADSNIGVWDLRSRQFEYSKAGHEKAVSVVAITPNGRYAISGSDDSTLRVWDLQTGEIKYLFTDHEEAVYILVATLDGYHAISGSDDGTLRVWDLQTGRLIHTLKVWEPVKRDNWLTQGRRRKLPEYSAMSRAMVVTPDGRRAISGHGDGTLNVWDLQTGQLSRTLASDVGTTSVVDVVDVTIAPDGRCAISSHLNGTLRVWDLQSGQVLHNNLTHSQVLTMTPDGRRAISGHKDGTLRVWDLQTGQTVYTLTGHKGSVLCVAVTPDGHSVISGSTHGSLSVWNLQTGHLIDTLTGHEGEVRTITLTSDGKRIISGSADRTLRVWDLQTRREMAAVALEASLSCIAVTQDGTIILAGDIVGNVYCLHNVAPEAPFFS